MDYVGPLFRALNPLWAKEPLSGAGAAKFGGRFNPKGTPALYTSLRPETAIREANQVGSFQPITLVSYRAAITNIFDGLDEALLARHVLTAKLLANPGWRDAMVSGQLARTHQLALDLIAAGYNGLIVPSFAPGSGADDRNLILWTWSFVPPAELHLIDDENRLRPM